MSTQTSLQSCSLGKQLLLPAPWPLEVVLPPPDEVAWPEDELLEVL